MRRVHRLAGYCSQHPHRPARKLVDAGLLERREYQLDPVRHEYVLTDSGRDFFPVMAAMKPGATPGRTVGKSSR
ncbi:winged helix-turn-helix transcriptional regulator [Nocardia fluminea]|uniref:winged helix-turn-helix transcriptional regulator n=1 Tax=Nocardia fluminea TaxID=134984 RepID=UPI003650126B